MEKFGGTNSFALDELELFDLKAVRNWDLIKCFEEGFKITAEQQKANPQIFTKGRDRTVGREKQKAEVYDRFVAHAGRSAEFLEMAEDSDGPAFLVTLHGTNVGVVDSICSFGAKDLRTTDPGYAGAGLYSSLQAQYAGLYLSCNGNVL